MGASRDRSRPLGLAARAYFASARGDDPLLECRLDLRDRAGATVPGYGWIFPLGNGSVNVGAIYLTSAGRWRGSKTFDLLDRYVEEVTGPWGLASKPSAPAKGGYLPAGMAIGPRAGPNWVLVGDAAGAINPFTGEGISYAIETGLLGADVAHEALASGDLSLLARYSPRLEEELGSYYRLARAFTRIIRRPEATRALIRLALASETTAGWLVRAFTNLVDPGSGSAARALFHLLGRAARVRPT
jgi:flavin-dependent dehydrogenase